MEAPFKVGGVVEPPYFAGRERDVKVLARSAKNLDQHYLILAPRRAAPRELRPVRVSVPGETPIPQLAGGLTALVNATLPIVQAAEPWNPSWWALARFRGADIAEGFPMIGATRGRLPVRATVSVFQIS